jgi:hypothetical protein
MNPIKLGIPFDPWQGPDYGRDHEKLKVLILGESHYHSCETDKECPVEGRDEYHRNLTWTVASDWAAAAPAHLSHTGSQ